MHLQTALGGSTEATKAVRQCRRARFHILYPIQYEIQENVFILLAWRPNEYEDPIHSLTYLNVFCGGLGKCSLDFNALGQIVVIIIIAPCLSRPSRGAMKGQ